MIVFNCKITHALKISEYLQSQGLVYKIDYNWDYIKEDYGVVSQYYFECQDKKYETFIALKFS